MSTSEREQDRAQPRARADVNKFATTESRRKGALRAAEVKRERSRTHRQRVQDFIEENYELMFATFKRAMQEGDANKAWQAAAEIWNQGYGKPAQEITGADGGPLFGEAIEAGAERFLALVDSLAARAEGRARELDSAPPALPSGD